MKFFKSKISKNNYYLLLFYYINFKTQTMNNSENLSYSKSDDNLHLSCLGYDLNVNSCKTSVINYLY